MTLIKKVKIDDPRCRRIERVLVACSLLEVALHKALRYQYRIAVSYASQQECPVKVMKLKVQY